jgi:ribosomal protein S18 acetylase RimI-like enzyme
MRLAFGSWKNDMKIEIATAEDHDQLRTLFRTTYMKYVSRIGKEPEPMTADYGPMIERGLVFVIREGTTIIGAVVLENREGHLHLDSLAVSPEHQGRGVGRRLLKFAEEEALRRRLNEIRLFTNEKMWETIAIYTKCGYKETARKEESGFKRVYFSKTLTK